MNLKKIYKNLRFRFKSAAFMRVAYQSPRKVVMVTTRLNDIDNILPIDWHMPVSLEPKLYAICLESQNYSASIIRQTGEFVVNFVGAELDQKLLLCGKTSGRTTDKFLISGLSRKEARQVNVPLLAEAFGWLECQVTDTRVWGDHTVFVGKVLWETFDSKNIAELYHVSKINN